MNTPPSGWYPDPNGPPGQHRWWNAETQQWGEHVRESVPAPASPAPPAAPAAPAIASDPALLGGVVAMLAMLVGAFSPWASAPFGTTRSGTDGSGDGWVMLVLALIAGLMLYRARNKGRWPAIAWLIVGILGLAVSINDYSDVSGRSEFISVGWGLWACMVGSAALALIGLATLKRAR